MRKRDVVTLFLIIVLIALIVMAAGQAIDRKIDNKKELLCDYDSDCVPAPGCHAHSCVNLASYDQSQEPEFCTELFDYSAAYAPEDCECQWRQCMNKNLGRQFNQ
jgi:hypothetical protein